MEKIRSNGVMIISVIIGLAIGIILSVNLIGCAGEESKALKYEQAKKQAEEKFRELEKILKPIKALEKGDTSVFSKDPEYLKRLSKKSNIETIQKLGREASQAMQKVYELRPESSNDDYEQWIQKITQRWKALK